MSKTELLERIDRQILSLMAFGKDLSLLVQIIPGEETSRKLRHVQDSLGNAQSIVERARAQTHEIGDWE